MQMIIIAGQAGTGKSTLASFVANEAFSRGLTPVLLSFATPLKEEAERLGYDKATNLKKYREYCQELGSARREEDSDYWVLRFDEAVRAIKKDEEKSLNNNEKFWERVIICDDCRYLNELAYGSMFNASTVFISADGRGDLDLTSKWRMHTSEELARSIDLGNSGEILRTFTNIIYNDSDDGIQGLEATAKEMTPMWCGLTVDCYTDSKKCDCPMCSTGPGMPKLSDVITNLMDLLFLDELNEDDEEDYDYEPDEET
tara:strand:+ start:1107 stop:1877 length:771 start_codon:yes stop_codon:yes gene_type:complete